MPVCSNEPSPSELGEGVLPHQDKKWYVYIEVPGEYGADGVMLRYPSETLCLGCGLAVDAHPLETPEAVEERFRRDPNFRKGFGAMSRALSSSVLRLFKDQTVSTTKGIGIEVSVKVAFVTKAIYEARFTSVAKMKAATVDLHLPEGGKRTTGVLIPINDVPEDWGHASS